MSFDRRAFRNALGCFATGITVVTTVSDAGETFGLTANSFSSVSLDPPLVLFCLGRSSNALDVFTTSGRFAVNVLSETQRDLSVRFSTAIGDRWDGVEWEAWETGSPILKGCLASLDCTTESVHDGGDHVILVGRVKRLSSLPDGKPLLYYKGDYARLEE
ncbi:flavin reductase family protein [Skermanella mucosa]|uniref:flavin reductase family protein n=1 Tax=Skermanella mucosa TaxID=1789672 RepID=UPI00192CB19A|nr:flavin reductase family protein [Skermanella mucosa]UEM22765.1 flavin reductase family protein [Skermanella mucosa]